MNLVGGRVRPGSSDHPADPGSRTGSDTDQPSRSDRFVRALSQRLGGPVGRHGVTTRRWWNPARAALLTATGIYLLGIWFRSSCRQTVAGAAPEVYKHLCYSDIGILYSLRGLLEGNTPYLDSGNYQVLEYPVLSGVFIELARVLSVALGAPYGSGLSDQQKVDATLTFVDVNTVLLGICLLIAVWAQVRSVPHRPWDAMMVAASPCVALAALINWDLFAVALTTIGIWCWSRSRPGWAGVFWGLGMAAKLYPVLLLGPLLLLCLRSGRLRAYGLTLVGFVAGWAVVNLPVLLLAPQAWLSFWTFNSERGQDLGSIWYVIKLAGYRIEALNLVAVGLFAVACLGIAALILLAPRRPRVGSVFFLVLVAFLLTNKVYSPQYVLWLLPFVVLARPVWRDWLIFTAGELVYFAAIWWHLGGLLTPGNDGADRVYWSAVVLRMATQLWIVIMVVRDLWRPGHDVVRRGGHDDPTGGVLDGAADLRTLRVPRALSLSKGERG